MKIGFFDSGLGGLTILRAVVRALPEYDYAFYGDTAHLPYGDRTEAEIYDFSQRAMQYLFAEQNCLINIVACNSASAETLRKLQTDWLPVYYPERRILGVIIPTIEAFLALGGERGLMIATTRTVASQKYDRELALRGDGTKSFQSLALPALVPLIEAGDIAAAAEVVLAATSNRADFDTLILGCTHYTELKERLRTAYRASGREVLVISQDEVIPEKLAAYLNQHPELTAQLSRGYTRSIHLTAHKPEYNAIAAQLLKGAFVAGNNTERA